MSQFKEPQRSFKGVWIKASLWRRRDITWFEKCLLCEIDNLCNSEEKTPCFASNAYLAELMGTSEQTIQNAISKFRTLKLLIDWGFNGRVRQISLAQSVSSDPVSYDGDQTQEFAQPKPRGLPSPNPGVYIDTSRDTSVEKKRIESAEPPLPEKDSAVKVERAAFVEWWIPAIQNHNGQYRFDGKEGKHLNLLLKHTTAEKLRALIEAVWKSKGFYRDKLRSLAFLNSAFNNITAEVKPPKLNGQQTPAPPASEAKIHDPSFTAKILASRFSE